MNGQDGLPIYNQRIRSRGRASEPNATHAHSHSLNRQFNQNRIESMASSSSSSSLVLSLHNNKPSNRRRSITSHLPNRRRIRTVHASATAAPVAAAPGDLVAFILSKVKGTDRGVLLPVEGHKVVADVAQQLSDYCVDQPVTCPLIFGEWDVEYCSVPTSPGGGYRSAIGRLIFKTNEMVQVVEAPDIVRNRVSFSAFGFLGGEVSLKGKLKALDDKWIQVIFEPPELKIGSLGFQYGGYMTSIHVSFGFEIQ